MDLSVSRNYGDDEYPSDVRLLDEDTAELVAMVYCVEGDFYSVTRATDIDPDTLEEHVNQEMNSVEISQEAGRMDFEGKYEGDELIWSLDQGEGWLEIRGGGLNPEHAEDLYFEEDERWSQGQWNAILETATHHLSKSRSES